LHFERIRITASILIVTDTQIHLVACVEISKISRTADTQKNCQDRTMRKIKTTAFQWLKIPACQTALTFDV
jgi:hypothetical protein